MGEAEVAVGPAYRFVTDLGQDEAETSLPSPTSDLGMDADPDRDLREYLRGETHRLGPPAAAEPAWWDLSAPNSSPKKRARGI